MNRVFASLIDTVATGAWAARSRLVGYAILLIGVYLVAGVALVATGAGITDLSGRLIGADFGMIWSAGREALAGRADEIFSREIQIALQERLFGEAAGFTPWRYPPMFLLVAAPLATLPYLAALAVWQTTSSALYLVTIRACAGANAGRLGRWAMLGAAAFPAVFINAAHGQNGFLTAGLLTGGILLMRTHPVASGMLLALLSIKPQFCLLIPVVIVVERNWRAMASGAASGFALLGATYALFGAEVFRAFFASLPEAQLLTLETSATGWEKMQSVFTGLRLMGASYGFAMVAQVAAAMLVMASLVIVLRSSADLRLKQALIFSGVLLTTPYCFDYDMVLLAPALVLLAMHGLERGFFRWEISLLALVFVTPMIARTFATATDAPLGAPVMMILFGWTLRRAWLDARVACCRPSPVFKTSPDPRLPSATPRLSR